MIIHKTKGDVLIDEGDIELLNGWEIEIYKGVTFFDRAKHFPSKPLGKQWRAYTRVNGRRIWFGYYATQEDAARGYNENAKRLFGEYAWLNAV